MTQGYKYDHGPWITTYTGRKIYPWDPRPVDIDIVDIAISLSRECRFGNHTNEFYSVAQHSVIASHLVSSHHALWALLHDAPEAYIGDMPKPLKAMVKGFEDAEARLMAAVCEKFDLPLEEPREVKEVDLLLLASEALVHQSVHPDNWHLELGVQPDPSLILDGWPEAQAFTAFMERFSHLVR